MFAKPTLVFGALLLAPQLLWASGQGQFARHPSHQPPPVTVGQGGDQSLFPIKKDGKWGYIDRNGAIVIPAQFEYAHYFSDGLARVGLASKSGFIDQRGSFVVEPSYVYGSDFSEGLALVQDHEGRLGFIDTRGRTAISLPPETLMAIGTSAAQFREGLVPFSVVRLPFQANRRWFGRLGRGFL